MHSEEKISQILDEKRPTLSQADKDLLWGTIETKVKTTAPTLSPYVFIFNLKNHMAPLALALILMLGTTGVVAASESARPGDTLFLVDQTVEDIRLALASSDSKTRLEGQFAAERLHELSSILTESIHQTVGTTTTPDVNNVSSTAPTPNTFEAEGRTRSTISTQDEERVNQAIALTLNYLTRSNISNDDKDALFTELASLLEGVPVKLDSNRIRIENDDEVRIQIRTSNTDDSRIEIRDGEDRIRIREKDGEIRTETKSIRDKNSDEDHDEDEEDEDDKEEAVDGQKAAVSTFNVVDYTSQTENRDEHDEESEGRDEKEQEDEWDEEDRNDDDDEKEPDEHGDEEQD
jgi:hypothetical protein